MCEVLECHDSYGYDEYDHSEILYTCQLDYSLWDLGNSTYASTTCGFIHDYIPFTGRDIDGVCRLPIPTSTPRPTLSGTAVATPTPSPDPEEEYFIAQLRENCGSVYDYDLVSRQTYECTFADRWCEIANVTHTNATDGRIVDYFSIETTCFRMPHWDEGCVLVDDYVPALNVCRLPLPNPTPRPEVEYFLDQIRENCDGVFNLPTETGILEPEQLIQPQLFMAISVSYCFFGDFFCEQYSNDKRIECWSDPNYSCVVDSDFAVDSECYLPLPPPPTITVATPVATPVRTPDVEADNFIASFKENCGNYSFPTPAAVQPQQPRPAELIDVPPSLVEHCSFANFVCYVRYDEAYACYDESGNPGSTDPKCEISSDLHFLPPAAPRNIQGISQKEKNIRMEYAEGICRLPLSSQPPPTSPMRTSPMTPIHTRTFTRSASPRRTARMSPSPDAEESYFLTRFKEECENSTISNDTIHHVSGMITAEYCRFADFICYARVDVFDHFKCYSQTANITSAEHHCTILTDFSGFDGGDGRCRIALPTTSPAVTNSKSVCISAAATAEETQGVSLKSTAIVAPPPADDDGSGIDIIYIVSAVGALVVLVIAVVVGVLICCRPRGSSTPPTIVVVSANPMVDEYLIDDDTFGRHRQPTQINPNAPDIQLFDMEEMDGLE
jgi:hypothetical protein